MVYEIPLKKLSDCNKLLSKLNRKLTRGGQSPVVFSVSDSYERSISVGRGFYFIKYVKVSVMADSVYHVNGYTLVGHFAYKGLGEPVVTSFVSEGIAHLATRECGHCKTKRNRSSIFLLRKDDDGSYLTVGSTCLLDFSDEVSADSILSYYSFIQGMVHLVALPVGFSDEDCLWGKGFVLDVVCRVIGKHGFHPTESECSTRGVVKSYLRGVMINLNGAMLDSSIYCLDGTVENVDMVSAVCHYYEKLDPKSDFEHNLKTVVSQELFGLKDLGYVAAAVNFYLTQLSSTSYQGHYGVVGETYSVSASIRFIRVVDGMYGQCRLYSFVCDGKELRFFSTRDIVNNEYSFTFVVKKHSNFRGSDYTDVRFVKFN